MIYDIFLSLIYYLEIFDIMNLCESLNKNLENEKWFYLLQKDKVIKKT